MLNNVIIKFSRQNLTIWRFNPTFSLFKSIFESSKTNFFIMVDYGSLPIILVIHKAS